MHDQHHQRISGDAEYGGYNIGPIYEIRLPNIDAGLAIDLHDTWIGRSSPGGTHTTSHSYQVEWTGTGAAITVMFHEPNF